jgi:hypothetical protein
MPGEHGEQEESGSRLGVARRLSLAVTVSLHRLLATLAGVALAGLPRAGGLPVLRGGGTMPDARAQLESALVLLGRLSPGLRRRLQHHVTGLFLMRRPPAHGSPALPAPALLDVTRPSNRLVERGAMVRCATKGWLWRSGRGCSSGGRARDPRAT